MALKVCPRPTFRHKVTARVPIDGGFRDETFHVRFQLASNPEADLSADSLKDAFLRDVVVEIDELVDPHGDPLPWSDEVREAVFALPWARMAILRGYFEAVVGGRAGN